MLLRHKFGFLAFVYASSILATLAISGWCIAVYFQSAFRDYRFSLTIQDELEWLRSLVQRQRSLIESSGSPDRLNTYERIGSDITSVMQEIGMGIGRDTHLWESIQQAIERKDSAARTYFDTLAKARARGDTVPLPSDRTLGAFDDLNHLLARAGGTFSMQRDRNVERAAVTQQRVVAALVVNGVCATLICVLGLVLVWRWVVQPVGELRGATKEIGRGNLSYRITPQSKDELGQLAEDVNEMSSTISQMQKDLVQKERQAAAGEMVGRIAHNIRNPLAGIRGLAEMSVELAAEDSEIRSCQGRIIDSVDQFVRWLRILEQSVSPMDLTLRPACVADMIENVVKAVQPLHDRCRVGMEKDVPDDIGKVVVDRFQIEQALVALLTNAVQASSPGQSVRVSASSPVDKPDHLRIVVSDDGVGIPPEIHKKVFLPYFTTRKDGTGVGLALAHKIITMHKGQLTVESSPGQGTTFGVVLPNLVRGV